MKTANHELICNDCLMPIMTPDTKAKLCKCDFKREELEKPKPLETAKEVHDLIARLANREADQEWALKP